VDTLSTANADHTTLTGEMGVRRDDSNTRARGRGRTEMLGEEERKIWRDGGAYYFLVEFPGSTSLPPYAGGRFHTRATQSRGVWATQLESRAGMLDA
jgi:hypothetical protein